MPLLQPELPTSRSQHFKCHQSAVQGVSLYRLDALQAKKAIKPQKCRTCPSQISKCPSPRVPIAFALAAAPPGVQIMPSLQPTLPIRISQHFKCHQSAVQGFSLYPLDALQAKKGNNPPKRGTCPSHFSECQCPMLPNPFVLAAPPPGVHIMPSFQIELPISRAQHFKCPQSAVQGLSLYPLDALQAKEGNKPPKESNLSLTILQVPVPNGPNSFFSGCGAPSGTHNALTST